MVTSDASRDVRHAKLSVVIFGAYLIGLGAILTLAPNVLLAIFRIPETNEFWIRILGALLVVIGYYYVEGGRHGSLWLMRASVPGRLGVAAVLGALVVGGVAPPVMALFAAVDVAGATWTAVALRRPAIRMPVGQRP